MNITFYECLLKPAIIIKEQKHPTNLMNYLMSYLLQAIDRPLAAQ
jgi:hypothetical protein